MGRVPRHLQPSAAGACRGGGPERDSSELERPRAKLLPAVELAPEPVNPVQQSTGPAAARTPAHVLHQPMTGHAPDGVELLRYAAFTKDGTGGNPAGVVLNADGLSEVRRLALAAEVGYSETAFLEQGSHDDEQRIRFYSPRAEVTFCAHATIAAAVALAERRGAGKLTFETLAGLI